MESAGQFERALSLAPPGSGGFAIERNALRARRSRIKRDRTRNQRELEVTLPGGTRGHGTLLARKVTPGRACAGPKGHDHSKFLRLRRELLEPGRRTRDNEVKCRREAQIPQCNNARESVYNSATPIQRMQYAERHYESRLACTFLLSWLMVPSLAGLRSE
jgi:hypothetical protein